MSEEHVLPQDGDDLSPGAMLARARAVRQLGISEVAERLKYGTRQIEALEADDYGHLPGTTFVRGMIRGYSKLVGMDPLPALKALERRNIPAQVTVDLRTKRIPFPDGNKRGTRLYLVLSVITLLAIVVVLYEWHFAQEPPAPVVVRAVPALPRPAPEAAVAAPAETENMAPRTPAAAAAPTTPVKAVAPVALAEPGKAPASRGNPRLIQLDFQRESWVEIKDRAGRTLLSQLNPAGTQKVVEGAPPFSVIIGNAANVRVTYKDASVDLMPHVKVEVARLTLE
jgi:cytoskeleton protein RodZ